MRLKFGQSAMYERLLKEKDREIDILAEQIEYLRAQLTLRGTHVPAPPIGPLPAGGAQLPLQEVKSYVSDEEIDAEVMLDNGEITKEQVLEVMEALGLGHEIELDNVSIQ